MNLNSPLFLCLILASMTFVLCQVEEEEEIQVKPKIFEDQVQVNLNDEVEAPNPENAAVIEDDLEEDEISSSLLTLEAVGLPSIENHVDNSTTQNDDDLTLTDEGNSTSSMTGNVTVPAVRPKRIACLRREPEMLMTQLPPETDVEYEDGSEPGTSDAGKILSVQQIVVEEPGVQVVNGSYLMQVLSEQYNSNVTNKSTPAECMLVFFYAKWCPFSADTAPHYNAMGRIFSDMNIYAVDSSRYPGVNTQFGILALPTILLFHNSKPVSKFNHTLFNLDNYAEFINILTGIEPTLPLEIIETDQVGPLPTVAEQEPDYYLYLAWLFTLICGLGYFSKSSFSKRLIESVQNNWREVEIQHEHID